MIKINEVARSALHPSIDISSSIFHAHFYSMLFSTSHTHPFNYLITLKLGLLKRAKEQNCHSTDYHRVFFYRLRASDFDKSLPGSLPVASPPAISCSVDGAWGSLSSLMHSKEGASTNDARALVGIEQGLVTFCSQRANLTPSPSPPLLNDNHVKSCMTPTHKHTHTHLYVTWGFNSKMT